MNAGDSRARFFIDTNVFVYSFDPTDPAKKTRAQDIIALALNSGRGVISTQVIQEFLNVALRKFERPLRSEDALAYLRVTLGPLCRHAPTPAFYERALQLQTEASLSFYDALIVAAAADLRCELLLTDDLQHGRTLAGVRIFNPFQDQEAPTG